MYRFRVCHCPVLLWRGAKVLGHPVHVFISVFISSVSDVADDDLLVRKS